MLDRGGRTKAAAAGHDGPVGGAVAGRLSRLAIAASLGLAIMIAGLAAPLIAGRAHASEDGRAAAIQSVIADQIAAFGAEDGARAYAHASPTIQQRFGNAATFMDMVRRGYRPVYQPRDYRFVALTEEGGVLLQDVLLTGPDGSLTLARYELVLIDGVWRINGCTLIQNGEGV